LLAYVMLAKIWRGELGIVDWQWSSKKIWNCMVGMVDGTGVLISMMGHR